MYVILLRNRRIPLVRFQDSQLPLEASISLSRPDRKLPPESHQRRDKALAAKLATWPRHSNSEYSYEVRHSIAPLVLLTHPLLRLSSLGSLEPVLQNLFDGLETQFLNFGRFPCIDRAVRNPSVSL